MRRTGALLLLVLAAACDTAEPDRTLTVDLLGAFSDTYVHVEVDGDEAFSGHVTTGAVLATAGAVTVGVDGGDHAVRVTVEGTATAEISVDPDETVTVGVSYDPGTHAVTLTPWATPIPHR